MRVTVLGSSAGAPSRTNPGSGYLVETSGASVWMDCGPGTFAELARRIDPVALDAVIVSHIHVDHSSDVLALYAHLAWGRKVDEPVRVLAPEGVSDRLAAFVGAEDRDHAFHRVLAFETVGDGSETVVGDLSIRFGDAVHSVPAVVTRIDGPASSLAYSGDTGWTENLLRVAAGADLFICEASFYNGESEGHLTYQLLLQRQADFDCRRLIMTHMGDDVLARLSTLDIEAASDGLRVTL